MRPLLHLLSIALVLPVSALAAGFIVLGRAIAAGSLWAMLYRLLLDYLWLVPWGAIGIVATLLAIAAGGFHPRTRRLAASCVAGLGIVATLVVVAPQVLGGSFSFADIPFLVPGLVAIAVAVWIAVSDPGNTPAAGGAGSTPTR
ncbi:MAG: hypothetical protein U1F51_00245 [Burkholderiales bacterium]